MNTTLKIEYNKYHKLINTELIISYISYKKVDTNIAI